MSLTALRRFSWLASAAFVATACSSNSNPGSADGSTSDAGTTDGGTTDGGTTDAGPAYPSGNLAGQGCDPMVPSDWCGFPFPSNVWLVDDAKTPTGKHVAFGKTTLPAVTGHTDPAPWTSSDGFSPGQAPMTYLAGATVTGLPTQDTIGDSLKSDCPTVLLDTSTTPPSLVPHFSEIDVSTSTATDQTFMIRPVVRLKDATRYIVAIRNVKDSMGTAIPPSDVFKALRDGTTSTDPTVASRTALYADIFAKLSAAGIDKTNLQIAWDYTTASRENNTAPLVTMRDLATAAVGATGPTYTIKKTTDNPDMYTARRIEGTMHAPLFLDHDAVTIDANTAHPDLSTGFMLQTDANGLPKMNGYGDFDFIVEIPASVMTTSDPMPILIQGHGLFSDRSEGQDGTSSTYNYLLKLANEKHYIAVSVDLLGWRSPGDATDVSQEDDREKAQGFLGAPAGQLRRLMDRGMQGMVNQLMAVKMMKGAFAQDPKVMFNGKSVIDTTKAYYRGDSQGGIYGLTFMALSQDVTRGYLGETGMPYNLLLMRSADFSPFLQGIGAYYGSSRNVQLVLGLMQMFWDRLEGDGFAPYITTNMLPSTPSHNILINDAIGDFQVTPLGAHIAARAVGAVNLKPVNREIYGITDADGPVMGNAILEFDFGLTSPETDVPPEVGNDPHDKVRIIDVVYDETDTFLRTGMAQNYCQGAVDGGMAPGKCIASDN